MIHLVIPLWIGIYFAVGLTAASALIGWLAAEPGIDGVADVIVAGSMALFTVVGWPVALTGAAWIELRNRRGRKLRAVRAKFGFENEG